MDFEAFGKRLVDLLDTGDGSLGDVDHVRVGTFLDVERDGVDTIVARCGGDCLDGVLDLRYFAELDDACCSRDIHVAHLVQVLELACGTHGGVLAAAANFTDGVVDVRCLEDTHDGRYVYAARLEHFLVEFDGDFAGRTTENIHACNTGNRSKQGLDLVFGLLTQFGRTDRTGEGEAHDCLGVDVEFRNNRRFDGIGEGCRRLLDFRAHVVCCHVHVRSHVEHGNEDAVVLHAYCLYVVDTINEFDGVFDRLDDGCLDFFGVCTRIDDDRRYHGHFEFRQQVYHHHAVGVDTENHHGQDDHEHGYRFIDTRLNHSKNLRSLIR